MGTADAADATGAGQSPAVAAAWRWIVAQGESDFVADHYSIAPDRTYPTDWIGAVSGTFDHDGDNPTVVDPASLRIDDPATVPASYTGVVRGHITLPPAAGRWIVQTYRDTATGRVQVPVQTPVDETGGFVLDLGTAPPVPAGTWALGLLDGQAGYAPTGVSWPAKPVYSGWVVRQYVVTDTEYLIGEQAAPADGTYAFAASRPGAKIFRLVATSGDTVLAQSFAATGLVRSLAGKQVTYTYDQALAVLVGTVLGTDTTALTSGLLAMQLDDGGYVDSSDWRSPAYGVPVERTGVTAFATYALLSRLQANDAHDAALNARVAAAARAGVAWLHDQRRSDGLIGAGIGDYRPDGSVDPTVRPAWVSTEHNIDAWQTIRLSTQIFGPDNDTDTPAELAAAMVADLWDEERFLQGLDPSGRPDKTDTLDVSSWGSLVLRDAGYAQRANAAVSHLQAFSSTEGSASGYRAYYPQPAFPQVAPNVWCEGTAGVVLARSRAGDAAGAATDLSALGRLQDADGALPYALVSDTAAGMTDAPSVAATCWFILAARAAAGLPSIWD